MDAAAGTANLPYCGAAPSAGQIWAHWNLDPVLLALFAAAAAGWLWRGRAAPGASAAFWGGWAILFAAFISPLCPLSSGLFAARSAHHLLLVALAPPLLAFAFRPDMRMPVGAAAALHVLIYWLWHVPGFYAAALGNDAIYWAMELSLLGSALAFWSALARGRGVAGEAGALLAVSAQMGFLGALLVFAPAPLYAPHLATAPLYGLSALQDQQLAGLTMWVAGLPVYLAAAAAIVLRRIGPASGATA